MSEVRTFFRHCPSCGRRFEIRVVGKELVDDTEIQMEKKNLGSLGGKELGPDPNVPITVDLEEFRYAYKCKHCGHMWSELREEKGAEWAKS